ncbi:hypothetical protein FB45DRAFT_1138486 [Roridomyces roridus]|uniref:Uncharacterized protein n=1 Tax=Roridomyces roridus TaxID=1738132 RepID=A0AAD7C1Z0_9AGAR|nr:hypothetical protein FB45DRAFT_1138486 [Roridomyces roridus]
MSLPARGRCLHCDDCGGTAYYRGTAVVGSPPTPDSACLCHHGYLAHLVNIVDDPSNPKNTLQRGPNRARKCGGFYSSRDHWVPGLPCDGCGASWLAHDGPTIPLSSISTSSGASTGSMSQPVVVSSSFTTPNLLSAPQTASSLFDNNPFVSKPQPTTAAVPATTSAFSDGHPNPGSHQVTYTTSRLDNPITMLTQAPRPIPARFVANPSASGTATQNRAASINRTTTGNGRSSRPQGGTRSHRFNQASGSSQSHQLEQFTEVTTLDEPISTANPAVVKFLIAMLPFSISHVDSSGLVGTVTYALRTSSRDLPNILARLKEYGLLLETFKVKAGAGDSFWQSMDASIREHLDAAFITLPGAGLSSYTFAQSLWELLAFWSATQSHERKLYAADALARDFTLDGLSKVLKQIRHPDHEHIKVLFVAPTQGHLEGPLPDNPFWPSHKCFAFRAMDGLPIINLDSTYETGLCVAGCPGQEDSSDSSAIVRRAKRDRSSDSVKKPPAQRRKSRNVAVSSDEFDSDSSSLPEATYQAILGRPLRPQTLKPEYVEISDSEPNVPPAPQPMTVAETEQQKLTAARQKFIKDTEDEIAQVLQNAIRTPVPKLTPVELLIWCAAITDAATASPDDIIALDISGPDIPSMAATLTELVDHLLSTPDDWEDFTPKDPKVTIARLPVCGCIFLPCGAHVQRVCLSHLSRRPMLTPCRYRNPDPAAADHLGAHGSGPERSVYLTALKKRLACEDRWASSNSSYKRPLFSPLKVVDHERAAAYRVDGAWAALFLVSLRLGPDPLCPFMLLAASQNSREWISELTLAEIHALDPSTAALLAPWFSVSHDRAFALPQEASHPALALAATYLPVQMSYFSKARSVEAHKELHVMLLCQIFYGCQDPYDMEEFKCFKAGVDLRLKGNHTFLSHFTGVAETKRLLATVYNRRFTSVNQALSLVRFAAKSSQPVVAGFYQEQFQLRFRRWARGVGFPPTLRGRFISEEQYQRDIDNPLARVNSLVQSITGTTLIPPESKFRLDLFLEEAEPQDQNDGPVRLHFHNCGRSLDVPFNGWLQNLLLQPVDYDDLQTVTEFDEWLSCEFSLRADDYNEI